MRVMHDNDLVHKSLPRTIDLKSVLIYFISKIIFVLEVQGFSWFLMLLLRRTFYVGVKSIVLSMTKHFVIDRLFLWMNKLGHFFLLKKQPRNWTDWIISVYPCLILLWNAFYLMMILKAQYERNNYTPTIGY